MNDNDRIRNFSSVQHCEWCEDGFAIVGRRPDDLPEYGPCPWCELGARIEFPSGQPTKKGLPPAKPSWGDLGYWQGRTPAVERAPVQSSPAYTRAENAIRWRLMLRRMAGADVNPAVAVEVANTQERIALLNAEAAR